MDQLGQFIMNHLGLWVALIGILLLIVINEWMTQQKAPKVLSPQTAVEKINHESAIVIDLREQDAFASGHIINATRANADDFSLPRMEKYKTKPIILVCKQGIQAKGLAAKIKSEGFENVMVLAGGMAAWQSAGLPLVKGKK